MFNFDSSTFESEKERNLYYKFFAGYFFNELIEGYPERLAAFYSLLSAPNFSIGDSHLPLSTPSPKSVHVSFDNHVDRMTGTLRGEFADIAIHDVANSLLVGIEAKYQDYWNYEKDIVQNEEKLDTAGRNLGVNHTLLCLLVTETKWNNVVAADKKQGSNYRKLRNHPGAAIVLLWESFLKLNCVVDEVSNYLIWQLSRNSQTK